MQSSVSLVPSERPTAVFARRDSTVIITFSGDWRRHAERPSIADLLGSIGMQGRTNRVELVDGGLSGWDTGFLVLLRRLSTDCTEVGREVICEGLPVGVRKLLALADTVEERRDARREEAVEPGLLDRINTAAQDATGSAAEMVAFLGEAALSLGRLAIGKARFRKADFAVILQDCSVQALPIVSLISVLVGLILAFVGAVQLRQFGAELYVANLVGIGMLREMGAIMTAVIMAGRTGAAFAAELGTMQVNEEIDALSTLGFQPMDFLVLPRILALVLVMPLLCLYADVLGILGGALIGVTLLDLPWIEYWTQTTTALRMQDLFIGLAKASIFGIIIALAGCQRGMAAGRSAAAVGQAATSSVVLAIVLVVVADGIFAVLLDILGL